MSVTGIDHVIVAVHALEDAQAVFRQFGFTMTPRGEHVKLMALNSLVMLDDSYIEVAQPTAFDAVGGILHTYMDGHGEGVSGVAFSHADAGAFADATGLSYVAAAREVDTELHKGTAKFGLTWLPDDTLADRLAFLTEHKTPELLWHPKLQAHQNGALRILRLTLRAAVPARAAMNCRRALRLPDAIGPTVDMQKNTLAFVTQDEMASRWSERARAVVSVATSDVQKTQTFCDGNLVIELIRAC